MARKAKANPWTGFAEIGQRNARWADEWFLSHVTDPVRRAELVEEAARVREARYKAVRDAARCRAECERAREAMAEAVRALRDL